MHAEQLEARPEVTQINATSLLTLLLETQECNGRPQARRNNGACQDKWSTYKIKNNKDHLQVWINDVITIDIKDKDRIDGPIALQAAESGQISFRNIKITSLE